MVTSVKNNSQLAAKIESFLSGKTKPKSESDTLATMSAMMWKKTLESAMKLTPTDENDAVTEPTLKATKDLMSTQLGIQMAVQLNDSWQAQLKYLKKD